MNETLRKLWELVKEHEQNRDGELDFMDKHGDDLSDFWTDEVSERHDEILDSIRTSSEKLRDAFRDALNDSSLEF